MNTYAIIIVITLVSVYILNIVADVLNLKAIKTELPEMFKEHHSPESYNKTQQYLKTNTKFSWITSTFDLCIVFVFWFSGGFNYLDKAVRHLEYGPVLSGILFTGLLIFAKAVISMPFDLYDTFVIEEKFGFNKTTIKTFISDTIKSVLIAIVIGVPIFSLILLFFETMGSYAWLICWSVVIFFALIMQYLVPSVIMPLFNKFEPVEEGELKEALMNYASSIKFPLQNVYRMDGSKRSTKSNAFFTGFGKSKRIVLFDTLIEQHSIPELVSVLAHEMGHFKLNHIKKTLLISLAQTGVMFYILSICLSRQGLFDAFYMDNMSVYAGLVFFSLLYTPVDFFSNIFMNMFSRKNEYEADNFAVTTTKDNFSLKEALVKLSVSNLSNLHPHPTYVFLNYSHPPLVERIRRIETAMIP